MMIRRLVSLQSLLLASCAVMLILIGLKGYGISQKMAWFDEAERLYAEKDLIQAETWYLKARNNTSIDYREDIISARLKELAPITDMKRQLAELSSQGAKATSKGDFDKLMDVYAKLSLLRNTYYTGNGPYSENYREISKSNNVSEKFVSYFAQFKDRFYADMDHNLDTGDYSNESFKWNLLRIPFNFYGDSSKQISELSAKFKTYDARRIKATASKGLYDTLFAEAKDMLDAYKSHQFEAPWITSTTKELIGSLLEYDLKEENYAAFAKHAKQYKEFANQADPGSSLTEYAEGQIARLMKKAKKMAAQGEYQEAINLYNALSGYQDTGEAVDQVKLAWMAAEPSQLLPIRSEGDSYQHVSGGTDAYGSKIYVTAADETNRIYFGRMNAQEQVQVLSNTDITSNATIRQLSIERKLSNKETPVLLVEADSASRNALYALFEVQDDRIELILWVEADNLTINPDGSLLVENPAGSGEGQIAIYERSGSYYEFTGVKTVIPEIAPEDIAQYPQKKVRFTCTISAPGEFETTAWAGDNYIVLTGDFQFSEGPAVITGTFVEYKDIMINEDLLNVPVVQVDSVEPSTLP
ncbi:hypothetical protein KB559_13145 [Paenibacillus sp. Marseille-P2973]|uniref:hypothetical protein n=1 Tax=Paenibacillus sp. Marseille-P2973 TaxID=1871032 RepID=UPI001B387827|nr:hypothetical protein [Paenibacillus sp. Marseille-P2973]MBQ4899790.1 hypothetical protein [Paenibacillus sp. Marseille-P2973]